jgi:hypothetical protein
MKNYKQFYFYILVYEQVHFVKFDYYMKFFIIMKLNNLKKFPLINTRFFCVITVRIFFFFLEKHFEFIDIKIDIYN